MTTPAFATGLVRVAVAPAGRRTPHRVTLSRGVRPAGRTADGGPAYAAEAWVPAGPFRRPRADEPVWADPDEPGEHVRVVRLNARAVAGLRRLHEATRPPRGREYAAAVDRLAAELLAANRGALGCRGRVRRTGLAESAAGLWTVTVHPETRRRIGLHVDSWFDAAVAARHRSPWRACANVGRADRWLLVVNRPLRQVMTDLGADPAAVTPNRLARDFLRRFPDYPVVRVRVRPGECYIAATEDLIHDGSSAGGHHPDLCYTFHGRFAVAGGGGE